MKLPPRWLRRLVLWPLPLALVVLLVLFAPVLLLVALVASFYLPGKLRAVRVLGLATVYLLVESVVVLAAFGLWVASGFGAHLHSERFREWHYHLLRWSVRRLVAGCSRLFVLEMRVNAVVRGPDGPVDVDAFEPTEPWPVIVMSRHAGPADSILVMDELMSRLGRRPRIVLKSVLQWDPAFDILLNRLPNRFVGGGSGATVHAVRDLATGMGPRDAFVIFPEGGNFTEGRRQRAIAWFERQGRNEEARRARGLRRVLAPRTGGALAALEGCADAAVAFVAHTGLDDIEGVRDLWRALPDHKVLEMAFDVVLPDDVPAAEAERVEMLWREWEAIDAWITGEPSGRGVQSGDA